MLLNLGSELLFIATMVFLPLLPGFIVYLKNRATKR